MKNFKYFIGLFVAALSIGCSSDNDVIDNVDSAEAPSEMSALFTITQDNTGKVTIYPNSKGATLYDVYFGDGTAEPAHMTPDQGGMEHNYAEGTYEVRIVAYGINGESTEFTKPLTVTFFAPENLEITATPETGNPYKKNFTAKADFETFFQIYFGEDPNETPVSFNEGETVSHTYATVGTYTVKVVALSGGAATTESTTTVTVIDPLLLPVTFESSNTISFGDFGGAVGAVANNPSQSGINTSNKVGRITKNPGAEVWAGTSFPLDQVINLTADGAIITIKAYSPAPGKIVKLKLENISNNTLSAEVDAVTTVANQWETLTYNFSAANNGNNFQRVVLFYDFGNNGTGSTFYFDDVKQTTGLPQIGLPLTFDNSALTYAFTGFGGANTTVVDNPASGGINTTPKVAKLVKNSGSEVWAGSFINLQQPIDFSSQQKIKIKVWSPQSGIVVKLKLENYANANINTEVDATTTTSNAWEELTYDFTGVNNANNYQRVVVFFAFGTAGTGASYYFDDIKLSN
ncbi:MAG: hypothetical protein CFE23_14115 [Flavobacterium sp. BFFFF1]|uniref:PKD domain-containing protein n=1 Tax=Flavobacterium sp. BFFFF1 TaxID=2015557 RepID=UPI000BCF1F88|nr:PKD domain-containing protein [Flavobacterium sp. BFFFF1]OYU79431.1 MAG: hypothetical protein CFE23_14115 [Flavobacterium sp. BFFFF1]